MKDEEPKKEWAHQQTIRKSKKSNEQPARKESRKKKVCMLAKFSNFLNLPIEELNFSNLNPIPANKMISRIK